MKDPIEQVLRRGLEELVRDKPALGPVDLGVVTRGGQGRHGRGAGRNQPPATRLLATAAALVLVAGVGLAGWFGLSQPERPTTAEPQATTAEPRSTPAEPQVTPPDQLTGVRWLATRIDGQRVRPEAGGAVPYLEVSWPTRVDGGDPCNEVSANYRLDGDQLRFNKLRVQPMSCGSTDRGQRSAYTSALRATTTMRREGLTLTLLGAADTVVLVFRAAAEPPPPKSIRVRNDTGVDFARVGAEFPDGTKVDYGPVGAGQSSGYGKVGEAVRYTFIRIRLADGREVTTQPFDDYVESRLEPGRYTYVLRIEGSGADAYVDLRFEADQ